MATTQQSLLFVFFGFMGSKRRHIEKYHKIFDEFQDCATIHSVYPLRDWKDTLNPARLNQLATHTIHKTMEFIAQQRASERAAIVVYYIFSNAGAMLMATINDTLCDDEKYKDCLQSQQMYINGIIYESCPGLLRPTLSINHMNCNVHAIIPSIKTYPIVVQSVVFSLNYLMAFVLYAVYKLGLFRHDLFTNFFEKLLCKRNPNLLSIPSLFLYSNGDKAVFVNHIEMFIKMKKDALTQHLRNNETDTDAKQAISSRVNETIRSHQFKDSEHVQHFVKYNTEYKFIVLQFLYSILKAHKPV